jgi:hypothetical protein
VNELAESLRLVFEKIGAFFDIFDLSFFVSGAVGLAALWMWITFAGLNFDYLGGWLQVVAVLAGSYVTGLVCFASGRWLRHAIFRRKEDKATDKAVEDLLHAHGLMKDPGLSHYVDPQNTHRGVGRLYVRMWAEMRKTKELANSLTFINRYWVMAATYDGLGFALILWISVVAMSLFEMGPLKDLGCTAGIAALVVLLFAMLATFREAERVWTYQIEELVAAIAAYRNKW